MKLRYAGVCRECGSDLPARTEAVYDSESKSVSCLGCAVPESASQAAEAAADVALTDGAQSKSGTAGSSARREHERRAARDEERLRARWGRLGGIAVALSDEKQSTKVWAVGAVGEERLGARLNSIASDDIAILHDRRIPGTKANIDHIAITRSGIWVIDAKRYKGRPTLRIEGGLLRPRVERLLVGKRDCTKLVDGVLKQVESVQEVVGEVPVTGALCFVEADWPMIGGAFATRGVNVLWPKRLADLLAESGEGQVDLAANRNALIARFGAA